MASYVSRGWLDAGVIPLGVIVTLWLLTLKTLAVRIKKSNNGVRMVGLSFL
jgi:hypothetical protein